ncbi:hypothetical protein [Streptomyces sp. NPDC086766]|uniref:hypothetical protein n=1 Tax=Streptomyces sp. NPDC086766 TaxID=3365754 RepID=UPI003807AA6E
MLLLPATAVPNAGGAAGQKRDVHLVFGYTGRVETVRIPAGVTVTVIADGAGGGACDVSRGGVGARVTTTLRPTTNPTTYRVEVGGAGRTGCATPNGRGGDGGWNGGGDGGRRPAGGTIDAGAGGGGASSVGVTGRLLVVAGGGGGGGAAYHQGSISVRGGNGGNGGLPNATAGGAGRAAGNGSPGQGGGGGSTTASRVGAGGEAGTGCNSTDGRRGERYAGVNVGTGGVGGSVRSPAGDCPDGAGPGGGGGGGDFAGGGGGAAGIPMGRAGFAGGAGGGGGSSFVRSGTDTSYELSSTGTQGHAGQVIIGWSTG